MLNNLFSILNNEPDPPKVKKPFRRVPSNGHVKDLPPLPIGNAWRRMLHAKTDEEYVTVLREVYSTWNYKELSAMILNCQEYELRYPSARGKLRIEVLQEILTIKN